MPEICRFGGMVIVMLFKDIQHTTNRIFMYTMAIMRLRSVWTAKCWPVLFPQSSLKSLSAGYYSTKKSFIKLGILPFKGNILIKSNRCKEGCLCLQKMALFMHRSHAKSFA